MKLRLRSYVGSISQAEVGLILVHDSAYRRVRIFDAFNDVPTCSDQRLEDQKAQVCHIALRFAVDQSQIP